MPSAGYDIGASLANSSASGADPFEEAGTVFNFGAGNENDLAGTANPATTSSATATTAMPGSSAESVSSTGAAPAAPASTAASALASTGLSSTSILLLAGAGLLLAWHFLKK